MGFAVVRQRVSSLNRPWYSALDFKFQVFPKLGFAFGVLTYFVERALSKHVESSSGLARAPQGSLASLASLGSLERALSKHVESSLDPARVPKTAAPAAVDPGGVP